MAFEQDLSHYLGKQWKTDYVIRPEVQNYLQHLRFDLNIPMIMKMDLLLLGSYTRFSCSLLM